MNTIATCVEHAFSGMIFAEARLDNCAAQRQRRHSERMRQIKAMGGARKAQAEGLGRMAHRSTGIGFTPFRAGVGKNSSRVLPLGSCPKLQTPFYGVQGEGDSRRPRKLIHL